VAKPRILLVDYGMGNLRSAGKGLEALGARVEISGSPVAFGRADGVVLPGVGAFSAAMRKLRSARLAEPLRRWIADDRPFLGICLGLQLLFDESAEFGRTRGLGSFRGRVVAFPRGLTVPHMGWNRLVPAKATWLLKGLPARPYVYFVHSFFPVPKDRRIIAAETLYGVRFASAVERGSVAGVQFHPEKSQRVGAKILKNFLGMVARRA
jgi:glutamine amidotransferase